MAIELEDSAVAIGHQDAPLMLDFGAIDNRVPIKVLVEEMYSESTKQTLHGEMSIYGIPGAELNESEHCKDSVLFALISNPMEVTESNSWLPLRHSIKVCI
jgi:hypothetical protein